MADADLGGRTGEAVHSPGVPPEAPQSVPLGQWKVTDSTDPEIPRAVVDLALERDALLIEIADGPTVRVDYEVARYAATEGPTGAVLYTNAGLIWLESVGPATSRDLRRALRVLEARRSAPVNTDPHAAALQRLVATRPSSIGVTRRQVTGAIVAIVGAVWMLGALSIEATTLPIVAPGVLVLIAGTGWYSGRPWAPFLLILGVLAMAAIVCVLYMLAAWAASWS